MFPKVLILALSKRVTSNVLEYVLKFLQLQVPVQLYKELLDHPNFTYLVLEIKKPGFEKLDSDGSPYITAFKIPKIMILIDNINMTGQLEPYLQS